MFFHRVSPWGDTGGVDMNRMPPEVRPSRPLVTLKIAQTLDGRVATSTGDSRWITGPEARREAHVLRATHGAVLVGVGTILDDDPSLTVRHTEGSNPARVVLDSGLRIPDWAKVLDTEVAPTIVATTSHANERRRKELEARGATVLTVPADPGGVSLIHVLRHLKAQQIDSVLVEGGPSVWTSFLRDRHLDRLVIFVAPKLIGAGRDAITDLGIREVADALTLEAAHWSTIGGDMMIDGTLVWPDSSPNSVQESEESYEE